MRFVISLLVGLYLPVAIADSAGAFPDPLSFQQAMQMAAQTYYFKIIEAESDLVAAQSQLELAESSMGFRAQLELEAAYIEPSEIAFDQSSNDSKNGNGQGA